MTDAWMIERRTLALEAIAEQLRISNLIAATQMEGGPYRDINRWTDGDRDSLSTAIGEIREGLGL